MHHSIAFIPAAKAGLCALVIMLFVGLYSPESSRAEPPPLDTHSATRTTTQTARIKGFNLNEAIEHIAHTHTLDANMLRTIIACESGGDPLAVGDNGMSHGLAQIHLPAHPHITEREAYDPLFSLSFLAHHLKAGNGHLWTCFTQHYAK